VNQSGGGLFEPTTNTYGVGTGGLGVKGDAGGGSSYYDGTKNKHYHRLKALQNTWIR